MQNFYGSFKSSPSHMFQQPSGKLNQAFSQPAYPMLDKQDFMNKGNVLYNNLGDKLLAEYVNEYKIHINSADRNIATYPSPFKMRVFLDNSSQQPSLRRNFERIKYISLDWLILPKTLSVDTTHATAVPPLLFPTDSHYSNSPVPVNSPVMSVLTHHKYIILKIDELSTDKNIGTSNLIDKNTFILYDDSKMGMDSVMWKSTHNTIIFQNSLLASLSSLTFSLYDEFGNPLSILDETGKDILKNNITGTSTNFNAFVDANDNQPSVQYTNNIYQVVYSLTIGVLENELNTLPNYTKS